MKIKDLKAVVDQGIQPVVEFTEGVNKLEVDPDVKMRCKVLCVDDSCDGMRLTCDFTEFDQYNRVYAKHNYFDEKSNPTKTWMQQKSYTPEKLQAYTLYADPEDDICVIVEDKYFLIWQRYQKEQTGESYVRWLERIVAIQSTEESTQHIPQQTNSAETKAVLPPRCVITGCFDDAEPTSVFCAWHNIGAQPLVNANKQARELVDLKICVSLAEARRICAAGGYEKAKQLAKQRLKPERPE